jgi:hypothetical protein
VAAARGVAADCQRIAAVGRGMPGDDFCSQHEEPGILLTTAAAAAAARSKNKKPGAVRPGLALE